MNLLTWLLLITGALCIIMATIGAIGRPISSIIKATIRPRQRKYLVSVVIAGSVAFLTSILIGQGAGWVTLFGTDFGYSIQSGSMVLSKAPGGFYQWWGHFADHEFTPMKFGMGYDRSGYGDFQDQTLPHIVTALGGNFHALILPFWILLAGFLIAIFLIGRRPQKNAEGVDGKPPEAPQPPH